MTPFGHHAITNSASAYTYSECLIIQFLPDLSSQTLNIQGKHSAMLQLIHKDYTCVQLCELKQFAVNKIVHVLK